MQLFQATGSQVIWMTRHIWSFDSGYAGDGIARVGQLLHVPDLPIDVRSFLARLALDHSVRFHQRGAAGPHGALYYLDAECRPDEVDPDHFAADQAGACYVVKAGRLAEAVVLEYRPGELVRVRYASGTTELVYTAQVHDCRLTAAWDVQDWQAKRAAGDR